MRHLISSPDYATEPRIDRIKNPPLIIRAWQPTNVSNVEKK